jgi:cell division protein FtsL
MRALIPVALVSVLIFASALQLVMTRYESKRLYMELHGLRLARDNLDRERGQLLLEQGTAGAHLRVEAIARQKLDMTVPNKEQIMRVYP